MATDSNGTSRIVLERSVDALRTVAHGSLPTLLRLIEFHRLAGRLRQHSPSGLETAVRHLYRGAVERHHRMELNARLISADERLQGCVQLKGPTCAYLTGDPDAIRFTSDIDLIGGDATALLDLGYRHLPGICHEAGTFVHRSLPVIDKHRYFPIWRTRLRPVVSRLQLGDILPFTRRHPACPPWRLADPALAAVVLAAHVHSNFVEHPLWRVGAVRLAEVIEYLQLKETPMFSAEDFHHLVALCGAEQSVAFTEDVVRVLAGGKATASHHAEIGRGILRPFELTLDLLLRPGAMVGLILRGGSRRHGDAPQAVQPCRIDQPGHIASEPRVAIQRSDQVIVRLALPGAFYKDEVRLSWASGSVAVQVTRPDGGRVVKTAGDASAPTSIAMRGSVVELEATVSLPFVLNTHSFVRELTSSWNDLYTKALVSSTCVVDRAAAGGTRAELRPV